MNIRALMAQLTYNDINTAELAEILEVSRTTVYRKLSGLSDFTCPEIGRIKQKLGLDAQELVDIFF